MRSDEQTLTDEHAESTVKAVLDELNVYDAEEVDKITAIYDYICENVTYDEAGLASKNPLSFSAYAALINKTSVCQGYANLFYRLALELGVDARVITGTGNGGPHAWNIVRVGTKYYNLDATWDAGKSTYEYFLCSEEDFEDHTRDDVYATEEFHAEYPMATETYGAGLPGDLDGNEELNTNDAIQLLLHVSMPTMFQISGDADFTGDGKIDTNDVIQLLLHLSLPSMFPLYK